MSEITLSVPHETGTQNHPAVPENQGIVSPVPSDICCRLWMPFFLRQKVLYTFVLVYFTLIVIMGGLFWYSTTHQGLLTADPDRFIFWQYAPTAVFTIIAAFWGQVEYRTKQLAPWKIMASPQKAQHSILLDFISPLSIVTFYKAAKTPGCRAVALATAVGLLIKLVTVLTTGLFVLQYTAIQVPTEMTTLTNFGGPNTTLFDHKMVDRRAAIRVYGIGNYSLPQPSGTYEQYTYQMFNNTKDWFRSLQVQGSQAIANITADISVFSARAECEPLTVRQIDSATHWVDSHKLHENGTATHELFADQYFVKLYFTLSSKTCSVIKHGNLWNTQKRHNKFGTDNNEDFEAFNEMICDDEDPRFLVLSTRTNVTYTKTALPKHLASLTGVACKPSYAIFSGTVTLNGNSSINSTPRIYIPPDAEPSSLPGVSASELFKAVAASHESQSNPNEVLDLLEYFAAIASGLSQEDILSDIKLFAKITQEFFSRVSAQLANIYFTIPSSTKFSGSSIEMQNRLVIRLEGFLPVEALLAFMGVLTAFIIRLRPNTVVSCDPGPVIGIASILARSNRLLKTLEGTGNASLQSIENRVYGKRYSVFSNGKFGISETPTSVWSIRPRTMTEDVWFSPIALSLPFKVTLVTVPIAICIALEVILQKSRAQNGFTDIAHDEYIHYSFTIIPTMTLVAVGMFFTALDFSIKVFQPYYLLRRRATSIIPISYTSMGKLSIYCLWDALQQRQVALSCVSLCMILAPFLTIAASGMFFTAAVTQRHNIQLSELSLVSEETWYSNASAIASAIAGTQRGYVIADLVLLDNLSTPLLTHENLVFPLVDFTVSSDKEFSGRLSTAEKNAQIPAYRARSNCTLLPHEMITNMTYFSDQKPPFQQYYTRFDAHASKGCGWATNETVDLNTRIMNNSYFGGWRTRTDGRVDWPWCPNAWAVFGYVGQKHVEDITVAYCKPFMEKVLTNVTFLAKDFSLVLSKPPIPDEATATFVQNISIGAIKSGYIGENNTPSSVLEGLFSIMLYGKNGTRPEELVGPTGHEKLITAIERSYGQVLAQVFNTNRNPPLPATAPMKAVLEVPYGLRLKQSEISTRILQGLLGAMTICAAITFATMDTRRVLPKDPCSIAAVASLFAGADMMGKDVIPEGTEQLTVKEIKEKGIFDGYLFSMGWWSSGRFGIDIGKADKEKPE
ncbi:uncharacterized protein K452DRAFT_309563 [Aplosporella prunicola CBS 121167]|uniref:Uncharacterized protein n=1 Tax=Aplosporella prunicola CBS 121167 TaxID=1176127 RepID=A0A6A6BAU1_9PEZI|nr:uncharacterized protein K452DRAFT_309563 [Aplosporella prunicola CBS 121167]KAF2141136.1 hypothetical protein K452DRAFT_309563 [Aplosporella prunicola CBS 121167]